MKATLRMPGAFVILLLFAPAATAQGEDASAEEETIQRTLVATWDAIENGDIDRYASYVHPDFTALGEYESTRISSKKTANGCASTATTLRCPES